MRQLTLFDKDNAALAGIVGVTAVVRAAMNRAAAKSSLSRAQIADNMNELAKRSGKRMTRGNAKTISLDTLEKWINPESEYVPSVQAMEMFMRALDDMAPLAAWLTLHGCELMTEEDRYYRDVGKTYLEKQEAARLHSEIIKRRKPS